MSGELVLKVLFESDHCRKLDVVCLPVCWSAVGLFTCSSLLQPQPLQDLAELLMLAEVWQFDVDSGSQSRSQVGRAGEDVAQVFVPHELVTSFLKQGLDLPERGTGFQVRWFLPLC